MRAQLRHLLDMAALPDVTIQVMDLRAPPHPGLLGLFEVVRFPGPWPTVVSQENLRDVTPHKEELYAVDLAAASWRKSSFSNGGEGCVEITDLPGGGVALRDSKNPSFPALRYTAEEWDAFRKGVAAGKL